MGCFYGQAKDSDVKLYYFFSQQDTVELKAELHQKGMSYKPMFIILDKDTIEITQINNREQPYRNTKPWLICTGIPERTDYSEKGIYIRLREFKKLN